MNLAHLPGLEARHVESMAAVAEGADVMSRSIAQDLRDVQRMHPSLIEIGPRRGCYDPAGQLPYFGAILTDAGREAVKTAWRTPHGVRK